MKKNACFPLHFLTFKLVIISQATRVLSGLVEPICCLNVVTAQYVIVTTCHLDYRQNSRIVWCDFHRGVLVSYIVGFLCVPLSWCLPALVPDYVVATQMSDGPIPGCRWWVAGTTQVGLGSDDPCAQWFPLQHTLKHTNRPSDMNRCL